MPSGNLPHGPGIAAANIRGDEVAVDLPRSLTRAGSDLRYGNTLPAPIANALLYVQPLFVQAVKSEVAQLLGAQLSSIPELKKVVVLYGDTVVLRDTLGAALAAIFDDAPSPQPPGAPLLTEHPPADEAGD